MYGGYSGLGPMGSSYSSLNSYSSSRNLTQNLRPNNPNDPNNQNPSNNPRKMLFEEWFKMMGGLRSVIELGFAAIAIANFYTHLSTMTKKVLGVVKKMLGGMIRLLQKGYSGTMLSKLANPSTRLRTFKKMVFAFVRTISVVLLCLAAKLKTQIRKQSQEKLLKLEEEYENIKRGEPEPELEEVDDDREIRMVKEAEEEHPINANL